jgi:hypothetical protein
VHFLNGGFVGGFNQTENNTSVYVYPICHALALVLFLDQHILAMSFGCIDGFDTGNMMDIHVDRHIRIYA